MARSFLRQYGAAYLALLAFVLLLCRTFRGDRTVYWGDLLLYFEPMYRLIQSALAKGDIPLWNSGILCGQPLLGNPQMGVFYPWLFLLQGRSVWDVIRIGTALHLWLAGVFSFHYLRRWTSGQWSALAGALVYAGSGCLLGRVQFPPMLYAAAYLPLLLCCCDIVIDSCGRHGRIRLALAASLSLLAAHPQMTYLCLIGAGAYCLARLHRATLRGFQLESPYRVARRIGGAMLLAFVLAAGLAQVQVLPAFQVMLESSREQMTPGQANRFYLDGLHLLTLLWPHFLGHPATADYWGAGNAWEPAIFIGWLPLVLIVWAASESRTDRFARFWLLAMAVSLWLALGTDAGLYWIAFYLLPGLSKFHDPARFLVLFTFGAASLTAIGFDAAVRDRRFASPASRAILLTCIAAPLVWMAPEWMPTASTPVLGVAPEIVSRNQMAPGPGRTYLPSHEVFSRNYISAGYSDYGETGSRAIRAMIDTLMPDLNVRYGIESASGYEPVPLRGAATIDGLARIAYRRGEPNFVSIASLLDVGTLILPSSVHFAVPFADLASENIHYRTLKALPIRRSAPIAWLVSRVRHVDGEMRVAACLTSSAFDPQTVALISDPVAQDEPDLESIFEAKHDSGTVTVVARSASRLDVETSGGGHSMFLVVGIAAFPGWSAAIDRRSATVHRVDGGMMGLYVPGGRHHVTLHYRPADYAVGLYGTLVGAMTVLIQITARIVGTRAKERTTGI